MTNDRSGFAQALAEAISDFIEHGFDSEWRLQFWLKELRRAAEWSLTPPETMNRALQSAFQDIYRRLIDRGQILKMHDGISRYTLAQVAPQLRGELDRRIMASANLIKLNRTEAVEKTLQRFAGWSTSIPAGGSDVTSRKEVKETARKALGQLPFIERRVLIDQGHKLTSALNEVVATGGGAVAAEWRSHAHQAGYNARKEHAARDKRVFLIRNNWAHKAGLVKPGDDGCVDDIERPSEFVYCRCFYRYLYNLRSLPADMLTAKGRAELERVKVA